MPHAKVPVFITVGGFFVITDITGQTEDPTLNVDLNITPDLGSTEVTGNANFRLWTNKNSWRLTTVRTNIDDGGTNITENDVSVNITKSVGPQADPNAGEIVAPFDQTTTLNDISTTTPVTVVQGSKKTTKAKNTGDDENYFQINTTYGITPDFYFEEGTFTTTITYSLVSP